MLNLNDFAKEVYQVAVEHGWYENEENRNEETKFALIHSEFSEALEEYRAGRPNVWFECKEWEKADADGCVLHSPGVCGLSPRAVCEGRGDKPEGVMIELIDGCIRILDYLGFKQFIIPEMFDTMDKTIEVSRRAFLDAECREIAELTPPQLINRIHTIVSDASRRENGVIKVITFIGAIGLTFLWIKENGENPEELMLMKHNYNKGRPYKHGGKRC